MLLSYYPIFSGKILSDCSLKKSRWFCISPQVTGRPYLVSQRDPTSAEKPGAALLTVLSMLCMGYPKKLFIRGRSEYSVEFWSSWCEPQRPNDSINWVKTMSGICSIPLDPHIDSRKDFGWTIVAIVACRNVARSVWLVKCHTQAHRLWDHFANCCVAALQVPSIPSAPFKPLFIGVQIYIYIYNIHKKSETIITIIIILLLIIIIYIYTYTHSLLIINTTPCVASLAPRLSLHLAPASDLFSQFSMSCRLSFWNCGRQPPWFSSKPFKLETFQILSILSIQPFKTNF